MVGGSSSTVRGIFSPFRLACAFLVILALILFHDSFGTDRALHKVIPSTGQQSRPSPSTLDRLGSWDEAHEDGKAADPAPTALSTSSDAPPPAQTSSHASYTSVPPTESAGAHTASGEDKWSSCHTVPGADKVMLVLKTGATEIYEKLPTHFVTLLQCTPHFMLFSDLKQTFGWCPVHDALAGVTRQFREHHEDFELYRKMEKRQREGQDVSVLKGDGGWNLDKWKFLPMLHQSFEAAGPEIEWFVYIEADTSLSWTNLLQWLATMDARKPFYLGSQNMIGETSFGHGGSGVVISRGAAEKLAVKRELEGKEEYDGRWDFVVSQSCCGDEVIARALLEAGVPLTPAWPLIQGETVATLDWTDNHWCTPAITWHHVSSPEVDQLWQFQSDWVDDFGWDRPYLYSDVFEHFIARHVSVNRTDWNNMSRDRRLVTKSLATDEDEDIDGLPQYERDAVTSMDACAEACRLSGQGQCVQWMFTPGKCHLGKDIRFGKSDENDDSEHWTSGWMQDRIEVFKTSQEGCSVRWEG